ncbi:bifunctional ADP-dependent NAD(P)H-hydrate dehydratase/NAD(P)H-hydrate epimerase [Ruania alkalisoli]|uniref:Bifunctional NAD(P)H-hydrate repair enzyme n=1 Tax=Ruania alkalisoli TaxID=2779775 RepID=A0A7M1SR44_9MICO|nr:bifunctional ADP-dependent NAD(P)H-hydrate dehydratase/NAD(P)H-hydrate epimerase [Ruania alkalisoli]QOR69945.1 bifunctional ADP-dependent NAD(P)H-hydrate dehydratase/NAD(P)H-hydrate epimerase [Ruania alkalisoli]
MIRGYGRQAVQAAEGPALSAGRPLMRWAAGGVAAAVRGELDGLGVPRSKARVLVLVGGGNNGGDGLFAAGLLAERGVVVSALLVREQVHADGLAFARRHGVRILVHAPDGAPALREEDSAGEAHSPIPDGVAWVREASLAQVWVDAMAGIGVRGGLRGASAAVVGVLDRLRQGQVRPARRVIAVDTPSGLSADGGVVSGPVLRADRTVTMGAMKAGLLLPPAAGLAGRVEVLELGLEPEFAAQAALVERLEAADVARLWPVPGPGDHKYTRGVLGVVAGSGTYPGAAVLTVGAALRTGCGMVRYLSKDGAVADRVLDHYPETVTTPGRVQALVLGPGLSDERDQDRVRERLAEVDELADAAGTPPPALVYDAGALSVLPQDPQVNRRRRAVLTPHAGELAELLSARGTPVDRARVEADPARWVRIAVEVTGATVLLKGAVTLIAGPSQAFDGGKGIRTGEVGLLSQADGSPWLATAGSGDVLAGILGALLATSEAPVPLLAAMAALVHGRAAHWANPGGPVTPSDFVRALPGTLAQVLTLR